MLAKKNRASTKTIEKIFKTGKFINSPVLTFKYKLNSGSASPKISFIAPKNVAKLSVDRNGLRRRGYQALKPYITKFSVGLEGAFIFKKPINTVVEIENEIKSILNKIN